MASRQQEDGSAQASPAQAPAIPGIDADAFNALVQQAVEAHLKKGAAPQKKRPAPTNNKVSYAGEDEGLSGPQLPTTISYDDGIMKQLGIANGSDLLYATTKRDMPQPGGKTVTVSFNTGKNSAARTFVVASHDQRQHMIAKPSSDKQRGRRTGGAAAQRTVHLRSDQVGPRPGTGAVRAVAADLGLYPDYADGFVVTSPDEDRVRDQVRTLYDQMHDHLAEEIHSATGRTGVRLTTILAYEKDEGGHLSGAGFTFDMPRITPDQTAMRQRTVVRFVIPKSSETGEHDVVVNVPVVMCTDPRGRPRSKHLYLGDGVAEAREVVYVETKKSGTDGGVQIIVIGSEDAATELFSTGQKERPRYMHTSSYLCQGDAICIYRELGPYVGHSALLTGRGTFTQGHALLFDHSKAPLVAMKRNERTSAGLYELVQSDANFSEVHAYLVHFTHHAQTHHTTLTLFLDDTFWAAALHEFSMAGEQMRLPEPLMVLFLLRYVAGRSIQIVDVSRFGHGDMSRVAVQMAVHGDSWALLWLACQLHMSQGVMSMIPDAAALACDHDQHMYLGTQPLQRMLHEYVSAADLSYDDPQRDTAVTVQRYRAASRSRVFHHRLIHAARAGGYLRFPRSPHWAGAVLERAVESSPRKTLATRSRDLDCADVAFTTLAVLQRAPDWVTDNQRGLVQFCAAANILLTRYLLDVEAGGQPDDAPVPKDKGKGKDRQPGDGDKGKGMGKGKGKARGEAEDTSGNARGGAVVCSSNVDVESMRDEVRLSVLGAIPDASDAAKGWLTGFASFLETPCTHGIVSTMDLAQCRSTSEVEHKALRKCDFVICPDSTTDVALALNLQGSVFVANTGMFSTISTNALLHDMLLLRALVPWSLSRLMSHAPCPQRVMSRFRSAVLNPDNMHAYLPGWYVAQDTGTRGTRAALFLKAVPAPDHEDGGHVDMSPRFVWSDNTVPWWAMAEWALGYRTMLRGANEQTTWDYFKQDTGEGSPIYNNLDIAMKSLGESLSATKETAVAKLLHDAASIMSDFTWGPVPSCCMVTPITFTWRMSALSS